MLEVLRKIAGSSRPATAAQLRDALSQIDEAALVARVAAAEVDYKEALLSADERRIEHAETLLEGARRELARARTAKEVLAERAAEADAAEAAVAQAAERAEIEAEADAVAAELRKAYPAAARQIIRVLEKLQAAEERVAIYNDRKRPAGEALLATVEARAFSYPSQFYAPIFTVLRTSLQPCGGQGGWGAARRETKISGIPV
ncbi:hypothetical protein APY04_2769 [Hyphomicrobium sulfonivorans]|uniref:Uncharacterized protein n=1 Tax=Hyphomicrobium sulfonivorans TaxID=121290 RepID=A0A109BB50_HYPSL|nr:hypothetical protein [Hyphomicrobium sulfonivorans]KWT65531.1 hypothetical protein APY04_2769 [Hyphomicrobium sulfonivorans]